jgi:hypothetical protein
VPDKHGRRRTRAEAVDYFDEPAGFLGGLGQAATRNPVDAFGLLVAAGLAGMIGINALFLQDGRPSTPSALTVPVPVPQAHPAPAPAPRQADALGSLLSGRQQSAAVPAQPATQARPTASTSSTAASVATPTAAPTRRAAAPVAEPAPGASGEADQGPSPRILAVQRVLAERGFGPVKADGYFGEETRAAIRRFERIVGLPQKGELTPEMLTALSKVSGKKLR